MITQTEHPQVIIEATESAGRIGARGLGTRLLLVTATLLSGLSIAVPALVMTFVYPVNRAEFVRIDGVRYGEAWPHLGYAILASLACGFVSSLLATLSPVAAAQGGKARNVKGSNPVATGAHWIMLCAILALVVSPSAYQSNVSLGLILVGLGLAGVAVAAWGVIHRCPFSLRFPRIAVFTSAVIPTVTVFGIPAAENSF